MPLDYTLAVLTHGNSRTLEQTLRSFQDKVNPHPARTLIHYDGNEQALALPPGIHAERYIDSQQRGFCEATRKLWRWASDEETEFVFWLEHDFTFLKPVDLGELAAPFMEEPTVCQMQLMRTPVSREEIAAGGLYQMREEDYTQRQWEPDFFDLAEEPRPWLEQRAYFTTNPSLMRSEFMAFNQWPDDNEPQCEGRFGIELVERGFSFGVWGSGEPWVQHNGIRDGHGY